MVEKEFEHEGLRLEMERMVVEPGLIGIILVAILDLVCNRKKFFLELRMCLGVSNKWQRTGKGVSQWSCAGRFPWDLGFCGEARELERNLLQPRHFVSRDRSWHGRFGIILFHCFFSSAPNRHPTHHGVSLEHREGSSMWCIVVLSR